MWNPSCRVSLERYEVEDFLRASKTEETKQSNICVFSFVTHKTHYYIAPGGGRGTCDFCNKHATPSAKQKLPDPVAVRAPGTVVPTSRPRDVPSLANQLHNNAAEHGLP